ncbi:MAG: hypothetical protein RQ722_08060 [Desulfuromonadales bacterium]|nr:hypothetical protein [Desulfuromonadales bacterium]
MEYGDKVTIRDGSKVDGFVGIIYRLEEGKALVLLDKQVLWPVDQLCLEPVDRNS